MEIFQRLAAEGFLSPQQLPERVWDKIRECQASSLEGVAFDISDLACIADVPDRALRAVLLAVASPSSRALFHTYDDCARISRKDLERAASGRLVVPHPGWPRTLSHAMLHVLEWCDYERPPPCSLLPSPTPHLRHGWDGVQAARIVGLTMVRSGTFPPVLPLHVVYGQVDHVGDLLRLHDGDPWMQFGVGIDSGSLVLFSPHQLVSWEWVASQLLPPADGDGHGSSGCGGDDTNDTCGINARQAGLLFSAALRGVQFPTGLLLSLLGRVEGDDATLKAFVYAACCSQRDQAAVVVGLLLSVVAPRGPPDSLGPGHHDAASSASCVEKEAAVFSLGLLQRSSGDRQLMLELFRLITQPADSPVALGAAMALGLVAGDIGAYTPSQLDQLVNWALGGDMLPCPAEDTSSSVYLQLAALLCLMLSAHRCSPLLEPLFRSPLRDGECGYVRFARTVAHQWFGATDAPAPFDSAAAADPWVVAAQGYALAFSPHSCRHRHADRLVEMAEAVHEHLQELAGAHPTYDGRSRLAVWLFCQDVLLLSACILRSGSRDEALLRLLRRHFASAPSSGFVDDYGRHLIHQQCLGFLFAGLGSFRIAPRDADGKEDSDRSLLLMATWPLWQHAHPSVSRAPHGDLNGFPLYHRYLWLLLLRRNDADSDDDGDLQETSGLDVQSLSASQLRMLALAQDLLPVQAPLQWSPLEVETELFKHRRPSLIVH